MVRTRDYVMQKAPRLLVDDKQNRGRHRIRTSDVVKKIVDASEVLAEDAMNRASFERQQ